MIITHIPTSSLSFVLCGLVCAAKWETVVLFGIQFVLTGGEMVVLCVLLVWIDGYYWHCLQGACYAHTCTCIDNFVLVLQQLHFWDTLQNESQNSKWPVTCIKKNQPPVECEHIILCIRTKVPIKHNTYLVSWPPMRVYNMPAYLSVVQNIVISG